MNRIDFARIDALLDGARAEDRKSLFEHEAYALLATAGAEAAPTFRFLDRRRRPTQADLDALPGTKVVLKIVSEDITHKTEAGGVRIVPKDLEAVTQVFERMLREVPERWTAHLEAKASRIPAGLKDLDTLALRAHFAERIRGVLLVGFVPADATGFGTEVFVGIRATGEFGPVISAGLGGVEMEALAERARPGAAVAIAPTGLVDGARFLELFKGTLSYQRLSGGLRGSERLVSDEGLVQAFQAFIDLANHYSAANPEAVLHLDELEVNPFVVAGGKIAPLDGVVSFRAAPAAATPRPLHKIERLLQPRSAAVIGVSEKSRNMGRIILENLLAAGFDREHAYVVRPGAEEIAGARCVPSIAELPEKVDLFVVAVGADQVPAVVSDLVDHDKANAVILIPGGLGEKEGSHEIERALKAKIQAAHRTEDGGPVFVGGNSMGVVSHPGRYDTWFIPEDKLPKSRGERDRKLAFISQSGAFIIANLSSNPDLDPAYALSIGNQIDLTAGDLVAHVKDDPAIEVIAVYMEGFRDGDGLAFSRAVEQAVAAGKDVVFYKAGRTQEGRSATAGHTASVAGDYAVCEAAVSLAGAYVAKDFEEFSDLLRLCLAFRGKRVGGDRLAAMSNAGFESVGLADGLKADGAELSLPRFGAAASERLADALKRHRLDGLVDVKNPFDVTPMAGDDAFVELAREALSDENVDVMACGIVPLTPALQTLEGADGGPGVDQPTSVACRLPEVAREVGKPMVAVVHSGHLFDALSARLEAGGVPVFRSADRAVRALARWVAGRPR